MPREAGSAVRRAAHLPSRSLTSHPTCRDLKSKNLLLTKSGAPRCQTWGPQRCTARRACVGRRHTRGGGGLLQPAFPPCLPRRSRRGGCMAGVGDRQASCLAGSAQGGMCCRGPGAVVEHRDQGACCWSAMHACRYLSAGSSNFGGTLAWAAPEMLLAAPCTHKASGVCVSAAAAAAARCPRRPPAARQLPLVPRPSRGAATSSFDKGRATARRMLATDAGPPLCLSTPSQ